MRDRTPAAAGGAKKGQPAPKKRPAKAGPADVPCLDCQITQLVLSATQRSIFDPGTAGKIGLINIREDEPLLRIRAVPSDSKCPCSWSNVEIEYVEVLTGAAKRMKRRHFKLAQLLETINVDPANPRNPYFAVTGCTMRIRIADINTDLRNGINTGKPPFSQGVVTRLTLAVKCGGTPVELRINYLDAGR
jgi:hypothetical protein